MADDNELREYLAGQIVERFAPSITSRQVDWFIAAIKGNPDVVLRALGGTKYMERGLPVNEVGYVFPVEAI